MIPTVAQAAHPELFANVHADRVFHDERDGEGDDDDSSDDC
jgi:hypothetical protein